MLDTKAAAEALGMEQYVDHVYRKCEAYLRRELPTYEDLDACTHYSQLGVLNYTRLLYIVAKNLAVRVWEDTIPDPKVFSEYLSKNVVLNQQIQSIIKRREAYFKHLDGLSQERKVDSSSANVRGPRKHGARRSSADDKYIKNYQQWKKENLKKTSRKLAYYGRKTAKDAEDAKSTEKKVSMSGSARRLSD
jgi:hypothetical protein